MVLVAQITSPIDQGDCRTLGPIQPQIDHAVTLMLDNPKKRGDGGFSWTVNTTE